MDRRIGTALLTCVVLVAPSFAEEVKIEAFVDDGCEIYINGQKLAIKPGKSTKADLNDEDVIGVKAWDTQGGTKGGFVMRITREDGTKLDTDPKWRYSSEETKGWDKKDFDDKKWKKVKSVQLDWLVKAVKEHFRKGRRPRVIWGRGGTVYFRRQIKFSEFKK